MSIPGIPASTYGTGGVPALAFTLNGQALPLGGAAFTYGAA